LGKYPDNGISDIWNGRKINELRNSLNNSDLSKGCDHCRDNIENNNFGAVGAQFFDIAPVNTRFPTMLEFELSNECNLKCIMCSSQYSSLIQKDLKTGSDIKNPYDEKFISELEEFIPSLVIAKFLGGEPFVIPIYYKLWQRIIEINPKCKIFVQTNATVLNNKIKELLSHGNFRIKVSLESFRQNTFESIRRNSDFNKVMDNVLYFANHSKKNHYPFGISVCPIQQNWKELPEIIHKCNQLNALVFFNSVWSPDECSLFNVSPSMLKEVISFLKSAHIPDNTKIEKKNKHCYEGLINQLAARLLILIKEVEINQRIDYPTWMILKKELEIITVNELSDKLCLKIKEYYLNNKLSSGQSMNEGEQLVTKFLKAIASIEDTIYFKLALYKLNNIPSENFIQVLKSFDLIKLSKRAKEIVESCQKEINELTEIYNSVKSG
jgi:sulfatase maturation enzyme AslB (radical SAM superfamily)